ncbi:DUF3592 domain-containing protein [Streptomyces sp. NPDC006458]|uniref:DUF3592 domain-containing protein n=1 Tax=Streptomyces sp. NPDC006458 TaxID=3154302 RepID=UPI0033BA540E
MDFIHTLGAWVTFAVAVGVAAACARKAWQTACLAMCGKKASGTVVRIRRDTDGDGDLITIPVVTFALPDGTWVEAEASMAQWRAGRLWEGAPIKLLYNPSKPTQIFIKGHDSTLAVFVLGGAAVLLLNVALRMLSILLT